MSSNQSINSLTPFSSTFPSPNTSNTLFDIFANSGISFILITFVGIRWLISVVGTLFNLFLFWITITEK